MPRCLSTLFSLFFIALASHAMKKTHTRSTRNHGYTLIEVVSVAAIIMFAGTFLFRISSSITGRGQYSTTDNRLTVVEAKIRQYYLAHERLPVNAAPLASEIPVSTSTLDLEQKYRMDGWGNPFLYIPAPGASLSVTITSGGPDQIISPPSIASDDIISNIDLTMEAAQVAQKKLQVLGKKVATYDALFAGIDNDGISVDSPINPNSPPSIDENPTAQANTGLVSTGCPPVSGFKNDPASGLPTLDAIERAKLGLGGNAYSCVANDLLAFHLATYYHLPTGFPGGYDKDPWNQPIQWGYIGRGLDDGTTIIDSMDFHYHKFFSSGPDNSTTTDDIIYNGQ